MSYLRAVVSSPIMMVCATGPIIYMSFRRRGAADVSGQPLEPIFQARCTVVIAAARAAGMRVEASAEQQTAAIGEDVAVDPVAPAP
jgi:hypothetical protein